MKHRDLQAAPFANPFNRIASHVIRRWMALPDIDDVSRHACFRELASRYEAPVLPVKNPLAGASSEALRAVLREERSALTRWEFACELASRHAWTSTALRMFPVELYPLAA